MGSESKDNKKGLQTELHPALRSSNLNLLRSKRENPYLDDDQYQRVQNKRRGGVFQFYKPGEVIEQANRLREAKAKELELQRLENERVEQENKLRQRKIEEGELPAEDEVSYVESFKNIPDVEWWDLKYLDSSNGVHPKFTLPYNNLDEDSEDDDVEDTRPSIRFVKHPLPVVKEFNASKNVVPRIYLTKKEQKKKRRNQRKLVRQEVEEKIKLGLEPKPEPKVKLSNMMHVLESNASIQDPTKWEQTVKQQVAQRKQKHLEINKQRSLEAKAERQANLKTKNSQKDTRYCKVYMFTQLKNPKIRFKLLTNGKQLLLKGCCLHLKQSAGVIVTIGDERSCKFFERLVTKRIQWTEPFVDKETTEEVRCDGAKCEKIWEGLVGDHMFRGWFMKECQNSNELKDILNTSGGQAFSHLDLNFLDEH
ncbi:HHL247Cp [Eremothecium sinecaudum]|uniref:HHL247Cp n=1 Tax=Eremothecium sinecaudum TaxID=45286 RepID=A0A0X8HW58_9SACH|nr:HHL247Cp [Eremothecium sinecaudum]AMD22523.1 HHL247Cp [Eremothecium sinecaudum]